MAIGRRYRLLVLALLLLAIAIGAGSKWWQNHQIRHAIAEIEAEMAAGRHAIAARRLTELLTWAPVVTRRPICWESASRLRGHIEQAEKAWKG